jgi:GcrA cell cycle regulator
MNAKFDADHDGGLIWTPERQAMAQRLYLDEKMSASLVAEAIGGVTRDAVLAKMRRMGVRKRRVADGGPEQPCRCRPDGAAERRPDRDHGHWRPRPAPTLPPKPLPPLREVPQQAGPLTLACLPADACRWPIDDPGAGRMHAALFCAAPAEGDTYCPAHRSIAGVRPKAGAEQLWRFLRWLL